MAEGAALAYTCITEDARGSPAVTQLDGGVTHSSREARVMGDDHGTAVAALLGDGGGNTRLPVPVLARRRLVEDKHWGARRHGGGDGN
jgi:hypothetical protein